MRIYNNNIIGRKSLIWHQQIKLKLKVKKDKENSKVSALSPREIVSTDRYVIGQRCKL